MINNSFRVLKREQPIRDVSKKDCEISEEAKLLEKLSLDVGFFNQYLFDRSTLFRNAKPIMTKSVSEYLLAMSKSRSKSITIRQRNLPRLQRERSPQSSRR
jgi:hypothetical protein